MHKPCDYIPIGNLTLAGKMTSFRFLEKVLLGLGLVEIRLWSNVHSGKSTTRSVSIRVFHWRLLR